MLDLLDQSNRIFRAEGFRSRDHFVKNRSQREQIGALVNRLSADLLGRAVGHQRPQAISRLGLDQTHI